MLGKQPNKPMVQADPSERTFTCYTAPGVAFGSEEEMKAHYQTEGHRYNLKRKVAGLAPTILADSSIFHFDGRHCHTITFYF